MAANTSASVPHPAALASTVLTLNMVSTALTAQKHAKPNEYSMQQKSTVPITPRAMRQVKSNVARARAHVHVPVLAYLTSTCAHTRSMALPPAYKAPSTQAAQARPRSPLPAYKAREREHARERGSQTLQETNINCVVGNGGARVVRWPGGHYSIHATAPAAPAASAAPASRKRTRDDDDEEAPTREGVVRAKKLVIGVQTNVGSAVYGAWHTFLPEQAQAQAPTARATGARIASQTNIGSVVVNGYEDDDVVTLAASASPQTPAPEPAKASAKASAKAPAKVQITDPALDISGCHIGAQLNFGGVVVNGGGSAVVIRRRAPGRGK